MSVTLRILRAGALGLIEMKPPSLGTSHSRSQRWELSDASRGMSHKARLLNRLIKVISACHPPI